MGLDLFFPQQLTNSMKVHAMFYDLAECKTFFSCCPNCRWGVKALVDVFVTQSRQLRKLIQQTFQQYGTLKEDECMVRFFETLKDFVSYDEEVFPCELVVSSDLRGPTR